MTTETIKIKKKSLTRLFELSFGFDEVDHIDLIPDQDQGLVELECPECQNSCDCSDDLESCECCDLKICKSCAYHDSEANKIPYCAKCYDGLKSDRQARKDLDNYYSFER